MGKGNKQVKAGEQTVINALPDYARPYFENIMERAEAESLNQFQPYQGERIAKSGSIADIADSRNMVRNIANMIADPIFILIFILFMMIDEFN